MHVLQPSPEQQQRTEEEINRVVREAMLLPNAGPGSQQGNRRPAISRSSSGSSELENYDPMFEEAYEAETTSRSDGDAAGSSQQQRQHAQRRG